MSRRWSVLVLAAGLLTAGCGVNAEIVPAGENAGPDMLQFRVVEEATPAGTAVMPPGAGDAATLDEVWAEVGSDAATVAQGLTAVPTDEETIRALMPFGLLSVSEVALLPPEVRFRVPAIGCAHLHAAVPYPYPSPSAKTVVCDVPADPAEATKYLLSPAEMNGADLSDATMSISKSNPGQHEITLTFSSAGAGKWATLTAAAQGEQVAVALGFDVLTAPTIQETMTGGNAVITGQFSPDEAEELARRLSGAATG